jgi:hypothetical protein
VVLCLLACLTALAAPGTLAGSEIDGAEDFAQISRNGFAMVVDGDFFGGQGYPNLVPHELGSPRNSYAWSMAWFDGRLYVGTTRDVLCFQGADLSACELNEEGQFVIGDDQRAEIWRYTPSVGDFGLSGTWERVFRAPQVGFPLNLFVPDLPRDFGYRGMTTCDAGGEERLYVTASGIPGHILYFDGLEFLPTSTAGLHASLGDLIDEEADLGYRSVVCFKGRLWTAPAGSAVDADGSLHPVLLMNPDPAGGAAWETILDTTSHPVLGDPGNIGIFQLATVGDYLYLSVGNRDTGFELWQADGSACDAPPGACALGWTKIIDNGGGRPADGVSPLVDNAGATLGVFRDQLYVGPAESGYFELTLAELMRVREDGTWELLVGWPRVDFATIPNMHCPFPVDIPIDNDTDVDDCYPTSFRGPGFGGNPFQPGTVSYFWRFVEHEDSFFLGTLELVDGDGADLYRSDDGVSWTPISKDGLGNPPNYGVRTLASVPGLGLVVGTANPFTTLPGGAEVWVGTTAPGEEILPVAAAGGDRTVFDPDQDGLVQVELDGEGSIDPLGGSGIAAYEWFEGTLAELGGDCAGISAEPLWTEASPEIELDSFDPGSGADILVYDFTLRVEDAVGNLVCDEVAISASRNLAPSAIITASVPFAPPPETNDSPDVRLVDFDGDGIESYELSGLCTDFEGEIVHCSWYLPDPGNTFSDPSGCVGVDRCELIASVDSVVPEDPVLVEAGISRPDVYLVVEDAAGYTDHFRFEARIQSVIDDPGANDPPVCASSTFTMVKDVDAELVVDPTAEPRLCRDPDANDSEITYVLRVSDRYPAAQYGTVTDGSVLTYTPDPDFAGTDTFYYRAVNPGAGAGDTATSVTVGLRVHVMEELEAPEAGVIFPANEALLTVSEFREGCGTPEGDVCGWASDDATGVERVLVAIHDADGSYWNGGAFTSVQPVYHDADGTTDWSYAFAPPGAGAYTVIAKAIDGAGKESDPAESAFETGAGDLTPPDAAITFPVDHGGYGPFLFVAGCDSFALEFCGTASDADSGVASVAVSIRRDRDGAYWDGAGFVAAAEPIYRPATGTTSWSCPVPLLPLGDYTVTVLATDHEGNGEPVSAGFTRLPIFRGFTLRAMRR